MTNAERKAFYFLIFIGFILLAKKIITENNIVLITHSCRSTLKKSIKCPTLVKGGYYVVKGVARGGARGIYKLYKCTYFVRYWASDTFHLLP